MCLHSLRQLVDDKRVASCQQTSLFEVGCQNVSSTSFLQAVSTSCDKLDFNRLDEMQVDEMDKFVANC